MFLVPALLIALQLLNLALFVREAVRWFICFIEAETADSNLDDSGLEDSNLDDSKLDDSDSDDSNLDDSSRWILGVMAPP